MPKNAPIAVFVYKRPVHTEKMLVSLSANQEFLDSPVYVYCDGPRISEDIDELERTREIIKNLNHPDIKINYAEKNNGLADSIIKGVTELCSLYGKVIVIEDDLILSPYFLNYMNRALDCYENSPKIMHVSGYMYPVKAELPETFFFRNTSSWGWGTWERAWAHFNKNSHELIEQIINGSSQSINDFNISGSVDYFTMLKRQAQGKIDSWAIRWDASVFLENGLSLYPGKSLVENIGHDGTGVHCVNQRDFDVDLAMNPIESFEDVIEENAAVLEIMKNFFKSLKKPFLTRVYSKVMRILKK
jgi:hypothetical protein